MNGIHFPENFGQGSGISRAHSEFLDRLNAMMGGGQAPGSNFALATRVMKPTVIIVDPINGDDNPKNPGTDTPLKSLSEAIRRISSVNVSGYVGTKYAYQILLKAGNHIMSPGMISDVHCPNVRFTGELLDVDNFVIKTVDNDLVISKDAGTPAWVPGEHKGKLVKVFSHADYGFGDIYEHNNIIDNTEHSLTLAWAPGVNPYRLPQVGDVIEIKDYGTKLIPSDYAYIRVASGTAEFENLVFNAVGLRNHFGTTISLISCMIENSSYGLINEGLAYITNLYALNLYGGVYSMSNGSYLAIRNLFANGCSYGARLSWAGYLDIYANIFGLNTANLIYLRYNSRCTLAANAWVKGCTNLLSASRGFVDVVNAYPLHLLSGSEKPVNTFNIKDASRLWLHKDTDLEASNIDKTFNVQGTEFSYADFRNAGIHNHKYLDNYGNQIYERA